MTDSLSRIAALRRAEARRTGRDPGRAWAKAQVQSDVLPPSPHPTIGVGTELKAILRRVGIVPSATCKCNARARIMDDNGPDWCEEHLEEIVGWLAEEATKRHLPFLRPAGRILVKTAIRSARRKLACLTRT